MRSKRASWVGVVLHPTFEIFMAAMLLLALLWFIHGVGEKTSFEKRFLATDLALLLDAIPAMPQPGNLYLMYNPQRSEKFNTSYGFHFFPNRVEVVTQQDDRQPGISYFTPDPALPVQEKDFPYRGAMIFPVLLKQGKRLGIDDINVRKIRYERNVLVCGSTPVTAPVASPAHASAPEAGIEQKIAAVAQAQQGSADSGRLVLLRTAQQGSGDGLLGIRIGAGPAEKVFIKAYVNGENAPGIVAQSERLGCEMVNSVLAYWSSKGIEGLGTAVIPINPEQTATADDDTVLAFGKVGVVLELGTINKKELFDDTPKLRELGLAIAEGVQHAQS